MPPKKGGNVKKESGRAKKAENKARKKEEAGAALPASNESRRNAKNLHAWLAEEEAALSGSKPKGTGQKGAAAKQKEKAKDVIPAGGLMAPPEDNPKDADAPEVDNPKKEPQKVEEYAATGLDDALEMMRLVNTKMDKASVEQAAASIESHPERRFKSAFEAYKERTLPELKDEKPGLRLQQYNDIMYKQFQKHPDNPFNQLRVA
ncbi:hypothetical protein FRC04_012226 [Tulasnella sp. 424]|nr:hypothetical protein FRC04_012226 [Tulasnella sp. 424]